MSATSTTSHINTSVRLTVDEKKALTSMATKLGVRPSVLIKRYFEEGLTRDSKKILKSEDEVMLRLHFDTVHYLKALASTLKPEMLEQITRASKESFHAFVRDFYEH